MIKEYINYLRNIRGYSAETCKGYEKDCRAFARWAATHLNNASWSTIERSDIDAYISEMATAGLMPATTNRKLASVSGLYRYMMREGLKVTNPCKMESRRKVANSVPNTIAESDLKRAYEAANGVTKISLGLLIATGMRIQEMLNLEAGDIDYQSGAIKLHGKGAKERVVYVPNEILNQLGAKLRSCQPRTKIFDMTQRDARYMIWNALQGYSTAKQLSPHAIRHTYATSLAKRGANVTTIATILGHSHIATTQKYIDMAAADVNKLMTHNAILNC